VDGDLTRLWISRPEEFSVCLQLNNLNTCEKIRSKFGSNLILETGTNKSTYIFTFLDFGEIEECGFTADLKVWLECPASVAQSCVNIKDSVRFFSCPASKDLASQHALESADLIISIAPFHDANIAVLNGVGKPLFVLELERLARTRYFNGIEETRHIGTPSVLSGVGGPGQPVLDVWRQAAQLVKVRLVNEFGYAVHSDSVRFKFGCYNPHPAAGFVDYNKGMGGIKELFLVDQWVEVNHHHSHAALGLWDAHVALGLRRPLILSYDGGGNDGVMLAFAGNVDAIHSEASSTDAATSRPCYALQRLNISDGTKLNLGAWYTQVGSSLPEVTGHSGIGRTTKSLEEWWAAGRTLGSWLALAGKLMGYSALGGTPDPRLVRAVRESMRSSASGSSETLHAEESGEEGEDIPLLMRGAVLRALRETFTVRRNKEVGNIGDLGDPRNNSTSHLLPRITRAEQRIYAGAAQTAFEDAVLDVLRGLLQHGVKSGGLGNDALLPFDGIVLTGGCGLNVLVNSAVARAFPHLPVYVPAAPSDCGLSIGQAWLVAPPPARAFVTSAKLSVGQERQFAAVLTHSNGSASSIDMPTRSQFKSGHQSAFGSQLQYLGWPLFDAESVDDLARHLGATRLNFKRNFDEDIGTIDNADKTQGGDGFLLLAALLADEQIIGVARGASEHGPRALGHRSLLARPSDGMKERLNFLKHREWWRPVAPVVTDVEAEILFERDSPSTPLHAPYMSFAPRVSPDAAALPAIAHVDGTARVQTVGPSDEPWLYSLLEAVKHRTGHAALINTSFNSRGKPILNTAREALDLLESCKDLDYVLVEDWLFSKDLVQFPVELINGGAPGTA